MKAIKPLTRPIIINGRVMYEERTRTHSLIRLKRRIIEEFSQLRSTKNWLYQMEFHRSYEATLERIKESKSKEEGIPLLIFIYEEKGA